MNTVIICIGTNYCSEYNIRCCKDILNATFRDIVYSDCIDTKPYGDRYVVDFKNQLGCFSTDLDAQNILIKIKEIESKMGRTKQDKLIGRVIIDIDLIKFNDDILKTKDWSRSYVQEMLPSLYEHCLLRQ